MTVCGSLYLNKSCSCNGVRLRRSTRFQRNRPECATVVVESGVGRARESPGVVAHVTVARVAARFRFFRRFRATGKAGGIDSTDDRQLVLQISLFGCAHRVISNRRIGRSVRESSVQGGMRNHSRTERDAAPEHRPPQTILLSDPERIRESVRPWPPGLRHWSLPLIRRP